MLYWLGAPGVSQLEYPPSSGTLYEVGDAIPGLSENEARAMTALGHSWELPNIYPYGSPYVEPPPTTTRRVTIAQRTGEPEGSAQGMILTGPVPQASWATIDPEPAPLAPPPPTPGVMIAGPVPQSSWAREPEPVVGVVATAIPDPNPPPTIMTYPGSGEGEGVVATAIADPDAAPLDELEPVRGPVGGLRGEPVAPETDMPVTPEGEPVPDNPASPREPLGPDAGAPVLPTNS